MKDPMRVAAGVKAAATNKRQFGKDYYAKIGAMGGELSRGGGFDPDYVAPDGRTGAEVARDAGRIGGKISRPPKKVEEAK